jgi:hypothetical protein
MVGDRSAELRRPNLTPWSVRGSGRGFGGSVFAATPALRVDVCAFAERGDALARHVAAGRVREAARLVRSQGGAPLVLHQLIPGNPVGLGE